MKTYLSGVLVTTGTAMAAYLMSPLFQGVGSVTLAILLGMVIGNIFRFSPALSNGIQFSEKKILEAAIVLMGFKLQVSAVVSLGTTSFMVIIPVMLTTILLGVGVSVLWGTGKKFGTLIGVGSAVCGASAIAAIAPSVNAKESELGVSIGVVNLMGTVGIFFFPPIIYLLNLSDTESAYLIGGTLQAIGHVIAAGFSINESVGDTATLIKMIRVLMIGPIALMASIVFSSSSNFSSKLKIPPFILGFILCSFLGELLLDTPYLLKGISQISKFLLAIAMAAVGMKIRYIDLIQQGPKALGIGTIVFTAQILILALILSLLRV